MLSAIFGEFLIESRWLEGGFFSLSGQESFSNWDDLLVDTSRDLAPPHKRMRMTMVTMAVRMEIPDFSVVPMNLPSAILSPLDAVYLYALTVWREGT